MALVLLSIAAKAWLHMTQPKDRLEEIEAFDCGDSSCYFAVSRGGMRTNGGCRCLKDARAPKIVAGLKWAVEEIKRLREENVHLAKLIQSERSVAAVIAAKYLNDVIKTLQERKSFIRRAIVHEKDSSDRGKR